MVSPLFGARAGRLEDLSVAAFRHDVDLVMAVSEHVYVLDFGQALIDLDKKPPYVYPPGTGMIWKITRTGQSCALPEEPGGGHAH